MRRYFEDAGAKALGVPGDRELVRVRDDAWGKPISTTGSLASALGKLNPFRYRGYVFDEETGLYYLRSRYYNPTWNRFINADTLIGGGMHNLFAYCGNMPIRGSDPSGTNYIDSFALKNNQEGIAWGGVVPAGIIAGSATLLWK